jgi:hypothetical protein
LPLLRKPDLDTQYSIKPEASADDSEEFSGEDYFDESDAERFKELERTAYARSLEPPSAAEIAEILAGLDLPDDEPGE